MAGRNLLDKIRPPGKEISSAADSLAEREKREIFQAAREEVELEGLRTDINARKTYGEKIFKLAICWLVGVAIVVVFQGFQLWGWKLSDNVLISLVAGSTGGVLGLLAAVIGYVFKVPRK